jgi:hypothetical protein
VNKESASLTKRLHPRCSAMPHKLAACRVVVMGFLGPDPRPRVAAAAATPLPSNMVHRDPMPDQVRTLSESHLPPSRASPEMAPRCGGGRHFLVQEWTLASACVPASRTSPETALRGVAEADNPLCLGMDACRCAHPTVTSKGSG